MGVETVLLLNCQNSKNSQRAQHVDCFRKKAPPQISERIPNVDPTRGAVNFFGGEGGRGGGGVQVGWTTSA